MKKKNYSAPQSKLIDVAAETGLCQGSDLTNQISNPFSVSSVPDEEEEW
ncbi:MAG: hypothetical protein IK041_08125 [Bacteroidales bacterium]|nr:hypothetical protein [Bacteroidales bacterium]